MKTFKLMNFSYAERYSLFRRRVIRNTSLTSRETALSNSPDDISLILFYIVPAIELRLLITVGITCTFQKVQ